MLFLLSLSCVALSQGGPDCFSMPYKKGNEAFKKGHYSDAKKNFSLAKECPTLPPNIDINKKIKECDNRLAAAKQSSNSVDKQPNNPATQQPSHSTTQQPKVHSFTFSTRATCKSNNGVWLKGVEVAISFVAEKMKGKTLHTSCQVWPEWDYIIFGEDANGENYSKKIALKKQSGENEMVSFNYRHTTFDVNGFPGQKGEDIVVNSDYDHITYYFFVPFGAMSLPYFDEQTFNAKIVINQQGNRTGKGAKPDFEQIGQFIETPISLLVDNKTDDQTHAFDCNGGVHDFEIENSCVDWTWEGVPQWIEAKPFSIAIQPNEDTLPRSATLTINPLDGGNKVRINITQEERSPVKITDYYPEFNIRSGRDYLTGFHTSFEVNGCKGKTMYVAVMFYNGDGTPLLDKNGNQVKTDAYVTVNAKNAIYRDNMLTISNTKFQHATNLKENEVLAKLQISFDNGTTWTVISNPVPISW